MGIAEAKYDLMGPLAARSASTLRLSSDTLILILICFFHRGQVKVVESGSVEAAAGKGAT